MSAEKSEKILLKCAIEKINEEIEEVYDCIENLKNTLAIPQNAAPMNPDRLEDLLKTKLIKFDQYIELCRQETLKKSHISYLLQDNSISLNPYKLPNTIFSEKYELNAKMQKMRKHLTEIEFQIKEIRSKTSRFSFILSPKPFLALAVFFSACIIPRFFI